MKIELRDALRRLFDPTPKDRQIIKGTVITPTKDHTKVPAVLSIGPSGLTAGVSFKDSEGANVVWTPQLPEEVTSPNEFLKQIKKITGFKKA